MRVQLQGGYRLFKNERVNKVMMGNSKLNTALKELLADRIANNFAPTNPHWTPLGTERDPKNAHKEQFAAVVDGKKIVCEVDRNAKTIEVLSL